MGTEIIFQHGWGFDSQAWSGWTKAFGDDVEILAGERGYFGARKHFPVFSEAAERKIIIAHSFGAHLLNAEALQHCDTLVLIGGFISLEKNVRAIRAMLKKFATSPDQVILDFWKNCYAPECEGWSFLPPPGMNETALEDDLARMPESRLDLSVLAAIPNVVIVNAELDRIVPTATQQELCEALPNAQVINVAAACHAMPLTQPEKCLQLVTHWISRKQAIQCHQQKS